jgi:GNAT superfamily N-acetyltransferase
MKIQEITFNEINQLSDIQPEGWPNIIPKFEYYTTSRFCFPIKVIIDNQIVGIGTTIIHDNCAWLAHIIVHPNHRNKGLGKIITQSLINQAHHKNCDTILLVATELGSSVYKKLGFKTTTEYLFYKVLKNKQKYANLDFIVPYTESFKNQILELDKKISGEDRLENMSQHIENSIIFFRNGKVEGYFMPTFGEGLIIATNKTAGLELLKFRLNTHENIIFPKDNSTLRQYMLENNYDLYYSAKRMTLGKDPKVDLSKIYARIGGNLG